MTYRVRKVHAGDDDARDEVKTLHKLVFGDTAPFPSLVDEPLDWWLVQDTLSKSFIAFAGMRIAFTVDGGYLIRSGVLPEHRGHGLQCKLIRVREALARKRGWQWMVSDTTNSISSSNNLIKAGYRIYSPEYPWAFSNTIYWRKKL